MSGEPTDAQLLTCTAVEADVSTFPRASANQIDASYGNYVFIHFSKTSDLVAYCYFMSNGGRLHGQSSGRLPSHLWSLV